MALCNNNNKFMHIPEVDAYIDYVQNSPDKTSKDIKLLIQNIVIPTLQRDDIFFDEKQYRDCLAFCEKWYYKLFPYQKFIYAFFFLYEHDFSGLPIFREFFIMMGRGNGKTGMAAPITHFLISSGHGVKEYNCDIISNSEDQAKLTFSAIYDVVNSPKWKKAYSVTKEVIKCKKTKSQIHYRSSNSKTADGFKAGILIFDELHSYEENNPMTVYKSELGKVMHPRILTITTNGFVRGAVFDRKLEQCEEVLSTGNLKRRIFPALYRIDNEKEAENPDNWIKANPSLPYMPALKAEMDAAWIDSQSDIKERTEFLTKRMNLPKQDSEQAVTSWENILATNQTVNINKLKNSQWVCGIDYSKLDDFAACVLLTKKDGKYYIIRNVWADRRNKYFSQIKAPINEWADKNLLTIIDDLEIRPELITHWIINQINAYGLDIASYAVDSYRFALLRKAMEDDLGIDATSKKQLLMVRPNDIQKISPVIDSAFNLHKICVGDDPVFRWCTNNSTLIPKANGNFIYGKQEPKLRKTDLFFAFVHAMCVSDQIEDEKPFDIDNMMVFTY